MTIESIHAHDDALPDIGLAGLSRVRPDASGETFVCEDCGRTVAKAVYEVIASPIFRGPETCLDCMPVAKVLTLAEALGVLVMLELLEGQERLIASPGIKEVSVAFDLT